MPYFFASMKIDYDTVHDIITKLRLKSEEDELTAWEVLDLLESELDEYEYEEFGGDFA